MEIYEKIVRFLYKHLPKEPREESRSSLLRNYYNEKYPITPTFYSGRVLPNSEKRIKVDVKVDVRDFFTLNDESLSLIVKSLKMTKMTDNQKALTCLKWVIEHVAYVSDNSRYGVPEYWCFPFETINTDNGKMFGDCEDGSILLANLMILAGIPNWKVRINCGYVLSPQKKTLEGHAYTCFFDEDKESWVILDWCYYANLLPISKRKEYKKESMYKGVWFSFNNKYSFVKDAGDLRKMNGISNS